MHKMLVIKYRYLSVYQSINLHIYRFVILPMIMYLPISIYECLPETDPTTQADYNVQWLGHMCLEKQG